MTPDTEQARQLATFERDYAELQIGRLYVRNARQQETIEALVRMLRDHGIDPQTGRRNGDQ